MSLQSATSSFGAGAPPRGSIRLAPFTVPVPRRPSAANRPSSTGPIPPAPSARASASRRTPDDPAQSAHARTTLRKTLVLAEKPSVARDLARALGVAPTGRSAFEGPSHVISWCVGHLVELDEPASYDPSWKLWRLDTLPMLPSRFRLRPSTSAPEQFRAVRALLRDTGRFGAVINACDAGREGELIFRYVYELSGCTLPVRRLWVSSLTDEALSRGFASLEPSSRFDGLADAARCRSESDWLVGLNATRAVTSRARTGSDRTLYSIGRVQTPTLALLARREEEIARFVPTPYWQIRGRFSAAEGSFSALWSHASGARLASDPLARSLIARCDSAAARPGCSPVVESVTTRRTREPPPLLFDLTSLQRTANKRFGLSAARTLEIAQALYERHKLLTYPRTDSRHLPRTLHAEAPTTLAALANLPEYTGFVAKIPSPTPAPRRMFDDARVSDHHAIIPTGRALAPGALSPDERRIFDLVARRFLAGFFDDAEFDDTTLVVRVGAASGLVPPAQPRTDPGTKAADREPPVLGALPAPPDRFVTRGRVRVRAGWLEVAGLDEDDSPAPRARRPASDRDDDGEDPREDERQPLPNLTEGQSLEGRYEPLEKKTRPPTRYTEAALLGAMESAGRAIDDEELRRAMRDRGLGTPATRASIIETLLTRGYARRERRLLVPTPLGAALVRALPVPALASPEMTGEWEARLARIERGEETREAFMHDINQFVRATIEAIKSAPVTVTPPETTATGASIGRCPRCAGSVVDRTGDYACAAGPSPCGLSIPKQIAGRAIAPALAAVLLRARRTLTLRGFRSRAGKPFAAALTLSDDGAIEFVFESGSHGRTDDAEPPRPASARRARAALSEQRDASDRPVSPSSAVTPPRPSKPAGPSKDPMREQADRDAISALRCPVCEKGRLLTGRRGWGCARWQEGCSFVLWFETAGRKLTVGQLTQLVTRGHTRTSLFRPGNGPPVKGRLVLDRAARDGSARFEPADA
jgi:DNA topoisomerase-3